LRCQGDLSETDSVVFPFFFSQDMVNPPETSYTLYMEPSNDAEKTGQGAHDERLPWHSAFFEAIQMELDEYRDNLQFIHEYHLTTKPLQIDVVII